jgi:hypothetical protein
MIMKDYFTPARCLLCFDKMNIYADIVVGDPHGIQGVDRINGESLVLIRTESGKEILKKAVESNEILVRPLPVDKALQGQNIDAKRKKWDIHYKAWKEMGYKLPDYPKTVNLNTLNINSDNIDMAKKNLEHALSLDKYKSRDLLIKDANNNYILPPFKASNGVMIKGVRVIENVGITEDTYLLGDFSRAKAFMRDPLEIRVWNQNDTDAEKNMSTVTANIRVAFRVKGPDADAFMSGTFSTDIAAITKP